ncbi:RND efflux system, outer membrane lipo, NodT family domain protein [Burkholderia pseudomallei MSHR4003]|nr:RND efflux system, outer membrane lipo, NodT family domain protein [Burkholderia pseudomallei MSHR4003]
MRRCQVSVETAAHETEFALQHARRPDSARIAGGVPPTRSGSRAIPRFIVDAARHATGAYACARRVRAALRLSGSQALRLSGSQALGLSGSRALGFSGSQALGSSGHQVLRRRFSGPASLRFSNVPALARSIPSARRLAPLVSACPRAPRPTFAFRRPCAPAGIGAANAAAARRNGPPPHVQRAATSCLPGSREPSAASLPQPPPSARIRLTVDTACVPVNWFDCSCDSSTERSLSITSR